MENREPRKIDINYIKNDHHKNVYDKIVSRGAD